MMSIGEFARAVGLSVSAVRFYADRGLLLPAQIEAATGYRSYVVAQLEQGQLIRDLRRMDMPLRDIEHALRLSGNGRNQFISSHLARLDDELRKAHEIAAVIGAANQGVQPVVGDATTVRTVDLIDACHQILPFASTDPETPDLMSVLIECKDGSVRLVATDRYRLAVRDIVVVGSNADFRAVVASATLLRWQRQLAVSDHVTVEVDDGQLAVVGDGVSLTTRVLPTVFPDYESILASAAAQTSVLVNRRQLLEAAETFDDQGAILFGTLADDHASLHRREISLQIPAVVQGPSTQVALDPVFLSQCLQNAIAQEVVVEIEGTDRPVVFRSANDGTYTTMLMPVKLP